MSRRVAIAAVAALVLAACGHTVERVQVQPNFVTKPPTCVAVLPLENLSLTSLAGLSFGELLAAELERSGRFTVMEPGVYRTLARELELGAFDVNDPAHRQLFHDRLGIDAVVVGSLSEYWYTDDPQVYRDKQPSIAFTARMVDTASGQNLWTARMTSTPGGMSGGIVMISEVAADAVAMVSDELVDAIGGPNEGALPGNPFSTQCAFEELLVASARRGATPARAVLGGASAAPANLPELSADAAELMDRLKRGESFVLRGVSFEYRQTTLGEGADATLAALGELLRAFPDLVVQVAAHSDNVGDPDELRDLTAQQAEAIRTKQVQDHGVSATQVVVQGRGGDEPLLPNINRRNRQINRRVELMLVTPPAGGW